MPETFELVQEEFRRRREAGKYTSAINCFASRIVCGDCGSFYGRKVWHSTSKYRRVVWQCNKKFKNKESCSTPHLREESIKQAFVEAFNSMIQNKDELLKGYDDIITALTNDVILSLNNSPFSLPHRRFSENGTEQFLIKGSLFNRL